MNTSSIGYKDWLQLHEFLLVHTGL